MRRAIYTKSVQPEMLSEKQHPEAGPLGQQGVGLTELARTAQKRRRTIGDRERMPVRQSSNMKADGKGRVLGALIEEAKPLKRADRQSVAIRYS
ncbi:MAG: hypothetical protein KME26_06130 [Oscillatoria princeps RMCB-10]|nr:hypothetical protein [Oscillatoria princeps RMCB-10]